MNKINMVFILMGIITVPVMLIGISIVESYKHPWEVMDCNEMLDWSATDDHSRLDENGHIDFHNYYFDKCNKEGLK